MTCRALRLIITGLIGASIGGAAVVASAAGEPTPAPLQTLTVAKPLQTLTIPKRTDLAAKPPSLDGLKAGGGLPPINTSLSAPTLAPLSPLSGLSLESPSLATPPARSLAGEESTPAITQKNGDIRYSVAPDAGFTPFVGFGAGRAAGLLNSGPSHTPYDTSDALHSYQGLVGFDYKLDKDTHLDFDYRMSSTQRPNVPQIDNANIADQGQDHAAILSLHYALDPVLRRPPD